MALKQKHDPEKHPKHTRYLRGGLILLTITTVFAVLWARKYDFKDILPRDKPHCVVCDKPAVRKSGKYRTSAFATEKQIWLCDKCPAPQFFSISQDGNKLGHKIIEKAYAKDPSDHCGPLLALIVTGYLVAACALNLYIKNK